MKRMMTVLGVLLAAASVPGVHEATAQGSEREAIRAAIEGGTILVCRHAITNSFSEREPVDYDEPSTQRQLNREGERQSRRMGEAMVTLGIEIGDLVASPMHRAYRTAELMFDRTVRIDGIWHTNGGPYDGDARDARLRFLAEPVTEGNTLIVSHIGTISSVIPEARGRVGEGDCVVVRPEEGGHELVGIVDWRAWIDATPGPPRPPGEKPMPAMKLTCG